MSRPVSDDDDDAELQMLRAAALRSKRSFPDEIGSGKQQLNLNDVRPIEAVESHPQLHSAVVQNTKAMHGDSWFSGSRVGIGRSNLIVIQTVPLDGEEQRPSITSIRPSKSVPNLLQLKTDSTSLLQRPQDKWDQKVVSEPNKKKAPTNKFSRYNSDSSSDSDDDDIDSDDDEDDSVSDSDAEIGESRTLCRTEDETITSNLVESSTIVYDFNNDDETLQPNEAMGGVSHERFSPIPLLESSGPSPTIVLPTPAATTINVTPPSVNTNSNLATFKQSSCAESVTVAKEFSAIESSSDLHEDKHSNWSDESSLSRSPMPIRSPLRLIKNPGIPVASQCRSPMRQTPQVDYRLSSPKAVHATSSRSPYIGQSQSPGKECSRASPNSRRWLSPLSPNRRRRSPVYRRSRSSSKPCYRSRSRSIEQRFNSKSPARNQRRVVSPNVAYRNRSITPNRCDRSKSPVMYQSRFSPKDTGIDKFPYHNDTIKYQLKLSPNVSGRERSRSPFYSVRSSLLPKVTYRSRSRSRDRIVRSKSPVVKGKRTLSQMIRRSRSRSADRAIKVPVTGLSMSPENTSRSPGSKLVSSSEQSRLSIQSQPQKYVFKSRQERQQKIYSEKAMSKSPDVTRSTYFKRSRSRSLSKSPERKPKHKNNSPGVDRNIRSRLGVTLSDGRYEQSKERKSRSLSSDRKLLPALNDSDISKRKFRSGSTERARRDKGTTSRSSRSPVQKKIRVAAQNSHPVEISSSIAVRSLRRDSPVTTSKKASVKSGKVSPRKSKSPVQRCRAHSSEKLSKSSISDSAKSGKRSRSKSLDRRAVISNSLRVEEKLPDSSTQLKRKHYYEKPQTGSLSQKTSPLSKSRAFNASVDKRSSKQQDVNHVKSIKSAVIGDKHDMDRAVHTVDCSKQDIKMKYLSKNDKVTNHKLETRNAVVNDELSRNYNSKEQLDSFVKPSRNLKLEIDKKNTIAMAEMLPLSCSVHLEEHDFCPKNVSDSCYIDSKDEFFSDLSDKESSSLSKKTLSNLSESSDEDKKNVNPRQKHLKERQDIVQPSFVRTERRKPGCERRHRFPLENEISQRLQDSPDDASSNRTGLKSVLSIVKVAGSKQSSADRQTDSNAAVKKKTDSFPSVSSEIDTVDTSVGGKSKKEKQPAIKNLQDHLISYELSEKVINTGVEVSDIPGKLRPSVHSRLGAPLGIVTVAASRLNATPPVAATTTNRTVTVDTRIARFGAVRHTSLDNSANVEKVDTSDLRNRIRRLDSVKLTDCSVRMRKQSKKNRHRQKKLDI